MTQLLYDKPGRPTKFSKPIREAVIAAYSKGATQLIAAKSAGVSVAALKSWLLKGKREGKGIYHRFFKDCEQAKAKGALACLEVVQTAASNGDWKSAAWFLERRWQYTREATKQEEVIEERKLAIQENPIDIVHEQLQELRQGMTAAKKSGSYQAFAALQRAFMQTYQEFQTLQENQTGMEGMEALPDSELIDVITDLYVSLPPILQDRILDKIARINNIIQLQR